MVAWRGYEFDMKDYEIFLQLKNNPSSTLHEIKSAVNTSSEISVSIETVRTRLLQMKEKGFLRVDKEITDPILGKRIQTEIEVVYLPHELGLRRQHVFFHQVPDRKSLNKLKLLCDEHPYTHYRTVAYSRGAVFYAQFDIPPATENEMKSLFEDLQKQGLFESFQTQNSLYTSKIPADFSQWDKKSNTWKIESALKSEPGLKQSALDIIWDKMIEHEKEIPSLPALELKKKVSLDSLDKLLLRELTINSKIPKKDLGDHHNRDPTTISRRVKKIRKSVAPDEQLYYDRSVFDLTYPQAIIGYFRPNSELNNSTLHHFVRSKLVPFECQLVSDEDSFVLFTTSSPSFAPEFSEFIWEHADNVSVLQMQFDSAFTYYFYHENHNDEIGWKTDQSYVRDVPLAALRTH
ncbi:MAG: hypothetical protein BAJATHORv1_110028 [Candidatus Thorarchaeota archaeon]|nr:MAG: hypothetical protein BAJATHORv1_110028 [Candidatus Thorarchaeota archaeon]